MRKRATDGTKISTSLSITKNIVSTRSRAERLRISIAGLGSPLPFLRSAGHVRELLFVRRDLLGVIIAIPAVDALVPFEGRGIQLAFGRWNRVEMPAGILAADQPGIHPHRAGKPAMRRDIADAEPDPPVIRPVGRRAMAAQRVMQREAAGWHLHHRCAALFERFDDRLAGAIDAVREPQCRVTHLPRPSP